MRQMQVGTQPVEHTYLLMYSKIDTVLKFQLLVPLKKKKKVKYRAEDCSVSEEQHITSSNNVRHVVIKKTETDQNSTNINRLTLTELMNIYLLTVYSAED